MSLIEKFTEIGKQKIDLSKLEAYMPSFQETKIIANGTMYMLPITIEKFEEILSKRSEFEEDRILYGTTLFDAMRFVNEIEELGREIEYRKENKHYLKHKQEYNQIILNFFKCHSYKGFIFQENLNSFINEFRNIQHKMYQESLSN